jgi:hypothetical protein
MSTFNPIDDLIDQIDDNAQNDLCCECHLASAHKEILSCGHQLCYSCMEALIEKATVNNCPGCSVVLTKNLHKIFAEILKNPVIKLSYYHQIDQGDQLWYYSGNNHNWLYSAEHCQILTAASENTDSEEEISEVELKITTGPITETYVVSIDDLVQYPKSFPNKIREIGTFHFKSATDLKKHKIIGVAGKLL